MRASLGDRGKKSSTNILPHHWMQISRWVCSWHELGDPGINMCLSRGTSFTSPRAINVSPLGGDIMDIAIQNPWFRRPFFPGFFPFRIFDQHFGDQWDSEFFAPFYTMFYYRPYFWRYPNWWESGISEIRMDKDRFVINLDVKHFSPEELSVKVNDEYVEIHGKHEERQDEHGYVAREFFRKYKVPSGVDPGAFTSCLSFDGVLSVSAPRNQQDIPERSIPITCEDKATAPK
ncbi:alpha-crystallin B chain-like isoform X2 [Hoplias malabaricus]|uniref:alpha-crystallin B chain-like isoform X2 n=1 Tax=Hoplias malabaricus TaxID=27720 RepID=UPI00346243C6